MTEWAIVMGLWSVGLALAVADAARYFRQWLGYRAICREVTAQAGDPARLRVAQGWQRDAFFQMGLRVLLATMAVIRLDLQFSAVARDQALFLGSSLQIGLAVLYLAILLWISQWSTLQMQERRTGERRRRERRR